MQRWQHLTQLIWRLGAITRPQIALQAALYTVLGAYLAQGLPLRQSGVVALAALVVALIVASGFVINDYADFELDRSTKPERPLPAGVMSLPNARQLAIVLAMLSSVVALLLPPAMLLMAWANLALSAAYSLWLKRTVLLGNIAIALLNSTVVIFGALATGAVPFIIWAVATMSLLYTLAQEILYTVDDAAGDAAGGLTTTAVYFGVGPSLVLVRWSFLLALVAAAAPLWVMSVGPWYMAALLLCTIGPVLLYILPLTVSPTPEQIHQACRAVKVTRVASILPLLALPVVS